MFDWPDRLGLAPTSMFARDEQPGEHLMLLDGVGGSFGVTIADRLDACPHPRDWAWSSGVLHHLTLAGEDLAVERWDRTDRVVLSSTAVNKNLPLFYEQITQQQATSVGSISNHALDAFRRLRSHFDPDAGVTALSVYLLLVAGMLEGRDGDADPAVAEAYGIVPEAVDALRGMSRDFVMHVVASFRRPKLPRGLELRTLPSLLVRHAGAMLFQDAHVEALGPGGYDLFGVPDAMPAGRAAGAGVHYTPPGLARALAEQALAALDPLPDQLTILDPACGSGSMLHEMIRVLRDHGYGGTVRVHGFDVSPAAVEMTRFLLAATMRDWPELRVTAATAERRDSLDARAWPESDVVVMNPPFVSLRDLTKGQRAALADTLGPFAKGRPDLSMAFVERASRSLRPGGVVATLLPAGVLTMTQAGDWRRHLFETCDVHLLASFAELGLFRAATVEVGALVMRKGGHPRSPTFSSLWVGERQGSASRALRFLRRATANGDSGSEEGRWSLEEWPSRAIASGHGWRPRPMAMLREIQAFAGRVGSTVGGVFNVRQGALPAPREAFIVDLATLEALPAAERRFFRRIAENGNIRQGRILDGEWIFYARSEGLPAVGDEGELAELVPVFLERLRRHEAALRARRGRGERWWELGEDRRWLRSPLPKVVTAYFGRVGSFAADVAGDHVVVQGYGWLPRSTALPGGVGAEDVLNANVALLNTEVFSRILAEFCPTVGGGQLNLSKRFVDSVPYPNLMARLDADGTDQVFWELASIGRSIARVGLARSPRSQADDIAAAIYGLR